MVAANDERRDELVERLFGSTIAALELFSIHLGWRLGLYEVLAANDALSADELSAHAGIDPRYAREWCEHQAVAGFMQVENGAKGRRYRLPPEYEPVFVERESPAYVVPFAPMIAGIGGALDRVTDAYRTGDGVAYEHYGSYFRDGQGAINRPAFVAEIGGWLTASAAIGERLRGDPPAKVADVGCGQGYSTVAIARAFPKVRVDGYDLDEPSIEDATRYASEQGASDRVAFAARDAGELKNEGPYDLVCIFEALHDMSRPVDVLVATREALSEGGRVLIADERVADDFFAPGDEIERLMYGWSVVHCLPVSLAEQPSAALGTVLRRGTVERLAAEAGFAEVSVLPIENDFFRFYELCP